MNTTRRSLLNSVTALVLCFVMLVGSTFAWFTDVATSKDNIIQTGKLDIGMYWSANNADWNDAEGDSPIFNYDRWEPGYTEVRYIKVTNDGSLAFQYHMLLEPNGEVSKLAEVIDVSYDIVTGNDNFVAPTADNKQGSLTKVGTLNDLISNNGSVAGGVLLPNSQRADGYYSGEIVVCISFHMQENADNEYQNLSIGTTFGIALYATQFDFENDSYDSSYDDEATWPEIPSVGNSASTEVDVDADGKVANAATINGDGMSAEIPEGVQLNSGVNKLTLSVSNKEESEANITLGENEELRALDVHVDGVAANNTVPMAITLNEALPVGLNIGNYTLHHVENGQTVVMTLLADGVTPTHNSFSYDPATGDVVLYLASFSEVALIAEPAKWEGNRDYKWYDESKTEFTIANADQLAGLSAIVGGMAKKDSEGNIYTSEGSDDNATVIQDSFGGKIIKLVSDINIGDLDSENGIVFYPIGYWNSDEDYVKHHTGVSSGFYTFNGTFDGSGHKISNFYQNTWEMKGDHDWYAATDEYYRDGMGLFGRVYGGTIKNLTVENFSSDGEITTTGTIAAYADNGALFENIAIVGCNPRVYNIGNGGIVGCVGWYNKNQNDTTPVTFRNITVDNTNKISALWGSWDVACGGIVGQYYPTSGQSSANYPKNAGMHFENCHVGAQIDVYNDVCANYQYYAYRYAGILVGSVRENETIDGHSYPKMDGITASGCTVHFGDWNDYYYCELVDNSTASYTHDYQMSRLVEVKAVNGTTITYLDGTIGTVPSSGRANYVVVDYTKGHGTDNATCYHFKDGEVWNHADAGYQTGMDENGDGWTDLREDKQHLYIEFNNLITGYGWGVTSKGVGDMAGVAILDREQANSVTKFEGKVTTITNGKEYKLSDIFALLNTDVQLIPGALTVAITNLDVDGNVTSIINYDRTNWANGTITFNGNGNVRITIQDYYFCKATSIDVKVGEGDSKTYIFESKDLEAAAAGTFSDGQTMTAGTNDYFTLILGSKTKIDSSSKTWEDGYTSGQRLNLAGKTTTSANAIKITTSGSATIKIWWVSNDDTASGARPIGILDEYGNIVDQDTSVVPKNETHFSTFEVGEAGTYYIGNMVNTNYFFKIEVIETGNTSGGTTCQHANTSTTTQNATCVNAGSTTVKCNDCGKTLSTTSIPATGTHNYVNNVCTVCGATTGSSTTSTVWEWYRTGKDNFGGTPNNFGTTVSSGNNAEGNREVTLANGNDYTVTYATKLSKGNSITVKTNDAGKLKIVCYSSSNEAQYTVDGGSGVVLSKGDHTLEIDVSEITEGQPHTITSTTKDIYIYYVSFIPTGSSSGGTTTCQHTNTTTTTVNATCTTAGSITVTCNACNAEVSKTAIPATGHDYQETITTAATCTSTGVLTYTCFDCDYKYTETIPATGHNYQSVITKEATCTENGIKTLTCSCGDTKTESIAALGHKYIGSTCANCGATTSTAGGEVHNFTTNGKTSSFYTISGNLSTSKGVVSYEGLTLSQCLKMESSTSITFNAPSAGTLTLVFVEATPNVKVDGNKISGSNGVITVDVSAGSHTITKADTMNLFYMVYTPSNVHTHSYTETITQAASCTNTGLKTLECSCGDTKTEVIAKLSHSYTETVTKTATCTAEGEITIKCSVCNDTKYETIPMVEHAWTGGSCTEGMTCSVCHTSKGATGHTWVDATCTAPKTCSVCGATEGLALGHSYTTATCASPAKCTRCGITSGGTAAHTPGDAASCTTAQTCTVCKTVLAAALGHNYVNNKCTRCNAVKPSESFKSFDGWFETAYAEWTDIAGADGYNAYVAVANGSSWIKVDDSLVRKTNGYWRVDAVGLKAGSYQIKVVPTKNGSELNSDAMTTDVIAVLEYDRSGYAHYNSTEGVGAYNDDGTLKDNAIVIYVTNENKNTVTLTYKGTTVTGIGNILGSTGMDNGSGTNSKGGKANTNQDILRKLAADNIPLVVRIIGNVKGASSTNMSTAVSEIDGLTAYDSADYGGSVGDNGFMARMSGGKNITIEGIGTDAAIDGWGLHFICSTADYQNGYGRSFEVRNITFKNVPEDCIGMEGQQEGSTLTAPVERCWIHNCSFIAPTITSPAESDKDGGDGACDFKRGNYFTNSYCYYEGYHKTNLVGSSDSSLQYHLTYHHNYWKNCDSRGPLARQANIHMYNNIFDGQTSYCMNPRANAYIFSEYNMFINSKNPVDVDSGAVKSYNDSFTSCTGNNNATIVTDKSTQVSTSNKYANFDTNASISYIPSGDYELQESITGMKAVVMAYTGVMKQVIVEPDEVNTSMIPADRMPTAAVVLNYSQSLNKNYVASNGTKDNIKFNVSKFNADSLTVGGTANGCDIVFYVDSNVNISMTEVSGTNHPILCNAAGETIIVGSGSAENLPAGYYFIQSSVYDPGSFKYKEAKIASLTIERAITCTNHTYTSKVTAPTCTSKGYTTYTCTNCGYSYTGNETAVVGHTPGAAATCTTAQTCTVCKTVITKALGHADDNADGKCDRCGLFDPATCKHTNTTAVVTAPTCTKTGYTTYTCKDCGNVSTGNQTPATGHIGGTAATCTTAQTCTVCSAVVTVALGHNYVNNKCTRCGAEKPTSSFIEVGGWFETAYAEWAPMAGVDGYAAYVTTAGSSSWIHLDNYLIRQYNGYWRVDAVGLAAGNYQIRVVPVVGENENASLAITSENITVQAHDRSGYAFVNGTSSGAYNENGTLKSGAVVIYVTEQNKNTVEATIDGNTYTGLSNILASSVLKNAKSPICVRFIGNITDLGTGTAFDKGDLLIDNSHNTSGLTIEGIGEDAVINGFGIRLKNSSNVEIRNLAVMNCDSNEGDNIGLQQANDHVWVHNCDFFYGHAGSDADQAKGDGQLDTKKSTYVTHSYNHFWDGGKVHLQGNGGDTSQFITYHHNWYDHCDSRMPRVRVADSIHVYNNFYDGISKYGIGATTGCSIFSEANYFLNVNAPMMISKQGTDAMGDGTFSGENGGMIKSYGDVMVGCKSFIPYSQNNTSFDAYVASSRNEKLSSSVVTLAGGTAYSNFDTEAGFYSYNVQSAEEAKVTVQNYAGRMNGGDFQWEFTDADNTSSAVNTALKNELVNYTSSIVSIGGVKE